MVDIFAPFRVAYTRDHSFIALILTVLAVLYYQAIDKKLLLHFLHTIHPWI